MTRTHAAHTSTAAPALVGLRSCPARCQQR